MNDRVRNKGGQPVYLHRNVSFYSLDDLVSGLDLDFFDLESSVKGFRLAVAVRTSASRARVQYAAEQC